MSRADTAEETSRHRRLFEVLREVHKVWDFGLVLSATVSGYVGEQRVRVLGEAVAGER